MSSSGAPRRSTQRCSPQIIAPCRLSNRRPGTEPPYLELQHRGRSQQAAFSHRKSTKHVAAIVTTVAYPVFRAFAMSFTHRKTTTCPEWYQKRFLPDGSGNTSSLKLHPKVTKLSKGRSWTETSCNHWGSSPVFLRERPSQHHAFRQWRSRTTTSKTQLFGALTATQRPQSSTSHGLPLRTHAGRAGAARPNGLHGRSGAAHTEGSRADSQNDALLGPQPLSARYAADSPAPPDHVARMRFWEMIDCGGSGIDLTCASDNPVTFYNRAIFSRRA